MNLSGKLLIAPPSVKGNFWSKTVILVTEHHEKGSMGIVLNKPSKMPIKEFAQNCNVECNIGGLMHVGGPVNVKALSILHSTDWKCANTMQINEHFAISSHPEILERLAMGDFPDHWRLFVGLCAWSPDQLESELLGRNPYSHDYSWLTATPNYEVVFGSDGSDQWTSSIEQSGMEFVQSILA